MKLFNEYAERWKDLSTQNQQNNFINDLKKIGKYESIKSLYDMAWNKCISEPSQKRKALQSEFNEQYPERVLFMDIDNNSPLDSLSNKLRHSGYTLPDLMTLSRYSMINADFDGVLSEQVIFPAPAKELINFIKSHVTDDNTDVNELLPFIYDFLNDGSNRLSDFVPPDHLVEALQTIKQELTPHPLTRPFYPFSEQSVSAFGTKYATRYGEMNDLVISCTDKSNNIMSFILYEYLIYYLIFTPVPLPGQLMKPQSVPCTRI